ncbi:disease resistance protein At4g27190 [Vitis vinifera]|uniref:disease resistance protein At4g27190 n=1 Tax=Vitis vinifera TaxID=29760 RepID=UPI00053FB6F1|nr:disease resistance protein At4g27190 [Vitis vinifera]|eukprot:XP_019078973.1 PREDICTED: disease resistance protein At4g27190-like [Vitis vinifera]
MVNKGRHEGWIRDVLQINRKVREMEKMLPKERKMTPVDTSKMYSEIITLLDHSMDDIEAYVPPEVINKMCKKSLAVDTTATIHTKETRSDSKVEQGKKGTIHRHSAVKQGEEASAQHGNIIFVPEKICDLAVDFAINQISRDIENPEVLRIGISGRDAIRVTSQLKNLPQIRKMFNVVVQVRASSYSTIADIEKHIAAQSGNSTLSRQEKAHRRMTVDLEIRMEDHLLSWKLFCMNVGKVVRSSHIQGVAIDVVERCCGHLLAIVLMGRALKEVNDVSIWKHASHALCVCPTSQMKDSILFNALAFICEQLGSKTNCVKHCALNMDKEGMDKVHLIQRWIKDGLIGTVGEGEVIVEDLLNAFLLESSQNGVSVRMRDEIREELGNLFGPKLNPPVLNLGGKGLTMPPNDEAWEEAGCELFMKVPPEVGELSNLEVLDFEGTEIISLPMDVGKLSKLTCLKLSFYGEDKDERKNNRSTTIIPHNVIGKLLQLEELSIDVNPDDERWNGTVKNIIKEVCSLKELKVLKLYLPEIVLLNDFMWNEIPFLSLSRFSFMVGGHLKRIISRLPRETTFEFKKQKRCLKYVNGEDIPVEIKEVLQHATALFLDRHLTLTKLSEFGIENMKKLEVCVLGECKEIQTLVDGAEINKQEDNARDVNEDTVLGSLQYLSIHYMKNLRSFWKGPVQKGCLSSLKSLALHTCPQLTTIFTLDLLENLNILEELVIENCPKIISLVTHELPAEEIQLCSIDHLPKLKKISLHYMHELISISSGLCIAPKVEWMSFYGCPNLKTLSPMDVSSSNLKGIIGEVDWWNELTWNVQKENLDSIFVPVKGVTELMNQIAEIGDQLQH